MSIRVLVADDHEVVRRGLVELFEGTDIKVVGEATAGPQVLTLVHTHKPDLILLDIRMPEGDGLDALSRLQMEHPETPVLVLSTYDNPAYIAKAVALGASGYVCKGADREKLFDAIRDVAAGKSAWSRTDLRRVTGAMVAPRLPPTVDVPLTQRETDVLMQIAEGRTNQEAAEQLGISIETVKEHVQNLLRKIGVRDRTQAAVWAVRCGLV
ncbi:MAG: response regulator transcription factor [Pirellulales bacterium]|nr:response regulator transcription factor [Pirellulales bacterium]